MAEEHNIPKVYDPASVEKKWYKYWEEHRYFHAEVEADKKPFSIYNHYSSFKLQNSRF